MTELKTRLIESDPIRLEGELPETDAQRMRRMVVAAANAPATSSAIWRRPFAFATLAALLVIVGAIAGHQRGEPQVALAPPEALTSGGGGDAERRQLQFSTPGGTRIIWIFDQNLRLQESMP
jgi:hypothetical protein